MQRPTRRQRTCLEALAQGPIMPKNAPAGSMRELHICRERGWVRMHLPKLPPGHSIWTAWVVHELTDEGRHALEECRCARGRNPAGTLPR